MCWFLFVRLNYVDFDVVDDVAAADDYDDGFEHITTVSWSDNVNHAFV